VLALLLSLAVTTSTLAVDVAELEAVTWELERRGLVAPDFGAWIARARPEFRWDAPHFRVMQDRLDKVTAGELSRVIFQVPIRHGKSEHNTISYGAYRLAKDPTDQLLVISHNQQLAHRFSRAIRRLAKSEGVAMSEERNTAGEWETAEGGGVTALGIGAGTASLNARCILIDDPIGKRADAESEATREATWDALTNDVLARARPGTSVVLTMSRWHMRDPVGRILDGEAGPDWHLVDLPARAEAGDILKRPVGAPLWPAELDSAWLDSKLAELGSYGFASLLQGRPSPRGGGMFKWDWWGLIVGVPAVGSMVRYWDMAGTDVTGSNDPDYTAGALACRMVDGRTALVDMARYRLSVAKRDAQIIEVAKADRETYGGRVTWWFETETGIAGKERTQALQRQVLNLGIPVSTEYASGKKEIRAEPFASKAEAGNVVLCPGEWRDAFRLEASQFPTGSHDDQVDAAVGADAKLSVPAPSVRFSSVSA
jgi:predicted phage terminase large subunit-like protein